MFIPNLVDEFMVIIIWFKYGNKGNGKFSFIFDQIYFMREPYIYKKGYICLINISVPYEVKNPCTIASQIMKWTDMECPNGKWY